MTEAVGVYVGVWLPLPVCEAVEVCEGERPAGSERVALAVMVLLAVPQGTSQELVQALQQLLQKQTQVQVGAGLFYQALEYAKTFSWAY